MKDIYLFQEMSEQLIVVGNIDIFDVTIANLFKFRCKEYCIKKILTG